MVKDAHVNGFGKVFYANNTINSGLLVNSIELLSFRVIYIFEHLHL
tara:strand:+ start:414 stop:551 length:138 start_codon:yes stop_codon:yes gene_type:complete